MGENFKYPMIAREKGISGSTIIEFHVNSSGRAIDPRIVFSTNPIFNKETIRLVREMPVREPYIVEGHPVIVKNSRTLKFSLGN